MSKVLLVVDMQEICVGEKHAKIFQYEDDLIEKVNEVIALNKNNIVIYIRNVMKKNLVNKFAPFKAYEGSEEIKLVKSLNVVSDFCFDKYEGDAFSNKELVEFCEEKQVKEIEVIGVDGGACVPLSALGACRLGYQVTVNTKAVGTMFTGKRKKFYERLERLGAKIV